MATRIVQANKARLPAENQPPPPNPLFVLSMVGKPDFSVTSIRRTEFLRTTRPRDGKPRQIDAKGGNWVYNSNRLGIQKGNPSQDEFSASSAS
jgi:hypothetical protein